jgi:CBS domain-containing protein
MQTDLMTVASSAPLSEVERLLAEHGIGGAPVTDEAGQIVGVISMRDLLDRYAQDPDARPRRGHAFYHLSSEELDEHDWDSFEVPEESEETARDVMTEQVFAVDSSAPVRAVAQRMRELEVHRILVTDASKRYVGIITSFDMLRVMAEA